MTTLTLVQNLLDTDISAIPSPSLAMDTVNQFSSTLSSGILDGIVSDYTVKGSKLIYKDPVFSNGGSEYQFRGSIVANLNSNGDATSASFNLQMMLTFDCFNRTFYRSFDVRTFGLYLRGHPQSCML